MRPGYRLYHYPLSPFCRKLRLVLAEKEVEFELVEEPYWERRKEFLLLNPAGKVPVLRSPDVIMCDSRAICEFLESVFPDPPLLPEDPYLQYEVRRLVAWFDEKVYQEVTSRLLMERMQRTIRRLGPPDGRSIRMARKSLKFHLEYIHFLLDNRRWLAGDRMSIADFAAAAHISCLDFIGDIEWEAAGAIKDWYATMKSRPAFRQLLAERIPGHTPPDHYADLDF